MSADVAFEQKYQSITLVRGKGDRNSGELCVMSFAALLAGEQHTDTPRAASACIRRFAVTLNDAIPDDRRQLLTPLAPRIVGTHDDLDGTRMHMLSQMFDEEILPRIREDFPDQWRTFCQDYPMTRAHQWSDSPLWARIFDSIGLAFALSRFHGEPAGSLARTLERCAKASPTPEKADWYWLKGIDILDRLCQVRLPASVADSSSNHPLSRGARRFALRAKKQRVSEKI